MAQQGKEVGVGDRIGFAYHLVKLVLLANGNGHEVDLLFFFFSIVVKPSIHFKHFPVQTLTFLKHIRHSYQ
jgi:hypothetical protein